MGIEGINQTLKSVISEVTGIQAKLNPQQQYGFYEGLPFTNFCGKKVAFDISIIIHQKMITAHNDIISKMTNVTQGYDHNVLQDRTFKQVIGFFGSILEAGITPVIVFDGETHEAKKDTVEERKEKKREKIEQVNSLTYNYMNTNPLQRTQAMLDEIKDSMKNMVRIKPEDYQCIRNILSSMGIVCLTAPHDAEKLCASLSLEKIVDAVYGNDTDNYPLGTSILISKIYGSSRGGLLCDVVYMEQVMYCMSLYCGWTFQMHNLVDLCILHGCDFNERMKIPTKTGKSLKSVGPKTALDYIKSYGYFENFPPELYPYMAPLQIGICRDRFRYEASGQTIDSTNMNWQTFLENYRQILQTHSVETYTSMSFSRINPRNLQLGNSYTMPENSNIGIERQNEIAHDSLSLIIPNYSQSVNELDLTDQKVSAQGFRM